MSAECAFSISEITIPFAGTQPWAMTTGPDGAMWFTDEGTESIGRVTTSGKVTEFPLGDTNRIPFDITVGPDGNLWFTELARGSAEGGVIGRITTAGNVTLFPSAHYFGPWNIASGVDGELWFTDELSGNIGRISTSGVVDPTQFSIPGEPGTGYREPFGIVAGPDGNMWITDDYNGIYKMTKTGTTTQYPLAAGNGSVQEPEYITVGPDKALWFALEMPYAIDRITTSGTTAQHTTYTAGLAGEGSPSGFIITGNDGALWYGAHAYYIGRMTTTGSFVECPTPTTTVSTGSGFSQPAGITQGPDDAIWFVEHDGGKIGRIPLSAAL